MHAEGSALSDHGATVGRLTLITPNFENNSLGRTFCLWLLANELGIQTRVVGIKGNMLWAPLAVGEFAVDCRVPESSDAKARLELVREHVRWADLVIAVKPLPTSFGIGLTICSEEQRLLVLDVDDPDLEVRTSWLAWYERMARWALKSRYRDLLRLRRLARTVPTIISNPTLGQWYPGTVVPHVRPRMLKTAGMTDGPPTVRFVGSPRGHKGIEILRAAVEELAPRGFRLEVTADPPSDAKPWESWLGTTSLPDGLALVAAADIIAIPSHAGGWARAQLPAKLVDAMIAGRAVVASDTPPVRWAIGSAGVLVPPGDAGSLSSALLSLESVDRRADLGRSAENRANELFSVEAVAPRFGSFLEDVLTASRRSESAVGEREENMVTKSNDRRVLIAVLTYRRLDSLAALLVELLEQEHPADCTVGILVVDNDPDGSGASTVDAFHADRVRYTHERQPGIAAARNRALAESGDADALIFIDDDERPVHGWLGEMLATHERFGGVGVVGPVVSEFESAMEPWVEAGQFFRRRRLVTGTPVEVAATNNLLLSLAVVRAWGLSFNEKFGLAGGSDTLFTRQITERGGRLIWCDEAVVIDIVPAHRLTRHWVLQRALRSGNSWSRVSLFLGRSVRERSRTRLSLLAEGGVRLTGGSARYLIGLIGRSDSLQARGARTAARGGGMLIGAIGLVYSEYARVDVSGRRRLSRIHREPSTDSSGRVGTVVWSGAHHG